ncbi:hypothetical protein V8F33_003145 [Rhypophila sp. PSN 637]
MADFQPTTNRSNPEGFSCCLGHPNCLTLYDCNQSWAEWAVQQGMRPDNEQLPGAVLPGGLDEDTGAGPTPGTNGAVDTILAVDPALLLLSGQQPGAVSAEVSAMEDTPVGPFSWDMDFGAAQLGAFVGAGNLGTPMVSSSAQYFPIMDAPSGSPDLPLANSDMGFDAGQPGAYGAMASTVTGSMGIPMVSSSGQQHSAVSVSGQLGVYGALGSTMTSNLGTPIVSSSGQQSHAAASNTDLPAATAASQAPPSSAAPKKRAAHARAPCRKRKRAEQVANSPGDESTTGPPDKQRREYLSGRQRQKQDENEGIVLAFSAYLQTPSKPKMTMDQFKARWRESGGKGTYPGPAVPMNGAVTPTPMGTLPTTTNNSNTSPTFVAGAAGAGNSPPYAGPATVAGSLGQQRTAALPMRPRPGPSPGYSTGHSSGLSYASSTGLPAAGLNGAGVLQPYASPATVAGSLGQQRAAGIPMRPRPRQSSSYPTGLASGLSNATAPLPTAGLNPFNVGLIPQLICGAPNGAFPASFPGLPPSTGLLAGTGLLDGADILPSPGFQPTAVGTLGVPNGTVPAPSPGFLPGTGFVPFPGFQSGTGLLPFSGFLPFHGFPPGTGFVPSPGFQPGPGFLPSPGVQPTTVGTSGTPDPSGTSGTSGTHGTDSAVYSDPARPSPQVDTAASPDAAVELAALLSSQPSEAGGPGLQPAAVGTSADIGGPHDTLVQDFTTFLNDYDQVYADMSRAAAMEILRLLPSEAESS